MKNRQKRGVPEMQERGQIWTQIVWGMVWAAVCDLKRFKVGFCNQKIKKCDNRAFRGNGFKVLEGDFKGYLAGLKAGLKKGVKIAQNGQKPQPRFLGFRGFTEVL